MTTESIQKRLILPAQPGGQIEDLPVPLCEIVIEAGKFRRQCPRAAVAFWNPRPGVWHPICQNHIDSVRAANLRYTMRLFGVESGPVVPEVPEEAPATATVE